MSNRIDMHLHSSYSDGTETPAQIFERAKSLGIKTISITDHDSIKGIKEEIDLAKKYGIQLIKGVELSTFSNIEIHILGYDFDENNEQLKQSLEEFSQKRIERVHLILEKLKKYNINLDYEELEKSQSIGRLHVAKLMIQKGYVSGIPEAFDKYLGSNGVAYFPSKRITPFEGIKLIAQAGGVPVIAHPLRLLQSRKLEDLIIGLKPYGLKGIEAYYPTHEEKTIKAILDLANKYKLLPTGGTDFHGKNRNIEMGSVEWTPNQFTARRFRIKE